MKRTILGLVVIPDSLKPRSSVQDLNERLKWGEPALTIVDVRDPASFYKSHIMGAINVPMESLVGKAQASLSVARDIYVHGETDEETATAAAQLRDAGFETVSELKGGLKAWESAKFAVERVAA